MSDEARKPLRFALVSADGSTLIAQTHTQEAMLNAAAQLEEDGEDVRTLIVEHNGEYDPATTALVQERMI